MTADEQQPALSTVHVLRLAAGEDVPQRMRHSADRRNRKLTNLMDELPSVLRDVGCTCLARKLALYYEDEIPKDNEGQNCALPKQRSTLHLLCQLRPLSEALRQAGYLDHALSCAELARSIEPTMDLNLLRAYLLLALGDNSRACRIYRIAIRKLGSIPAAELKRLEVLAESHFAEDDIAEIFTELKSCCIERN